VVDTVEVTAVELADVYRERWEIESAFGELKTHQRGSEVVLRSKSPDLVAQEIWVHLCCHYAIRTLMFEDAHTGGVDPDRVSFTNAINISRRSLAQASGFSSL
jgi:IS4 transposase